VVLRERVREGKSAVGCVLLDVPGYTYRIFVTNRTESAVITWRDYSGRVCIEQRIEELKNDLSAGGFCVCGFFGPESAFLAVIFVFNLLSLYQRQSTPGKPYRQPATWRTEVLIAGAVLGLIGKQIAIKLSLAWGGLVKHKPLLYAVLLWIASTPPKLDLAPTTGSSAVAIPGSTPPYFLMKSPGNFGFRVKQSFRGRSIFEASILADLAGVGDPVAEPVL